MKIQGAEWPEMDRRDLPMCLAALLETFLSFFTYTPQL